MSEFLPDKDFLEDLCLKVYDARLETGKDPKGNKISPKQEKIKRIKYSKIYEPFIRDALILLNEGCFPVPGQYIHRKNKK